MTGKAPRQGRLGEGSGEGQHARSSRREQGVQGECGTMTLGCRQTRGRGAGEGRKRPTMVSGEVQKRRRDSPSFASPGRAPRSGPQAGRTGNSEKAQRSGRRPDLQRYLVRFSSGSTFLERHAQQGSIYLRTGGEPYGIRCRLSHGRL